VAFGEMPSGQQSVTRAVGHWDGLRRGIKRIYCLARGDGKTYRCLQWSTKMITVWSIALTPSTRCQARLWLAAAF